MKSAFTQEWEIVTHSEVDLKCKLENWDLEFGSNTTEKFQKSLKDLKTREVQPNEFQFGIATLPSVMSMEKFGPTCLWLKMGNLT